MVFGTLGLTDSASLYLKLIDYTLTLEFVYSGVAIQIIQDSRSLKRLSAAGRGKLDFFNRPIHGLMFLHRLLIGALQDWIPAWLLARPSASHLELMAVKAVLAFSTTTTKARY
jgi:hypothetical protein